MAPSSLIPASRLFRFACHEDVTQMPVRAAGHHCESCRKTVVDMSRLTPEEAITTVRTATPSTCVSYAFSADGSLLFRSGRRLGGTVAVALSAFLAACNPAAEAPVSRSEVEQVEVEPLAQRPEEARFGESTVTPTSEPSYPGTATSWPAAIENTASDPPVRPSPPPPPRVTKPVPPKVQHTAGKPVRPVQHLAGGLASRDDTEL